MAPVLNSLLRRGPSYRWVPWVWVGREPPSPICRTPPFPLTPTSDPSVHWIGFCSRAKLHSFKEVKISLTLKHICSFEIRPFFDMEFRRKNIWVPWLSFVCRTSGEGSASVIKQKHTKTQNRTRGQNSFTKAKK